MEELVLPDGQIMLVKQGLSEEQKREKFRTHFLVEADIAYRAGDQAKVRAIVDFAKAQGIDLLN
jgi:hypothetical protein